MIQINLDTTPSHFKTSSHSIAKVFRNIHFLKHLYYFWQQVRCVIFPVNSDFFIIQLKIFFTQRALHSSFLSTKITAFHRRCCYKHLLFPTFLLVWTLGEVCNISNKCGLANKFAKYLYFYTRHLISLFISQKNGTLHRKGFSKHPRFLPLFNRFLPRFHYF